MKPSGDLFSSSPQMAVLRFESEPQGAEAKLPNGQACRTPCALSVPAQSSSVTFSLNGYLPQTVPVQVMLPDDMRMDSETNTAPPQPRLNPNPVYAELQLAPPPTRKPAPRKPAPRPAPRQAAPAAAAPAAQPAPAPSPASPWPAPQR